jgi:hypothetical protein
VVDGLSADSTVDRDGDDRSQHGLWDPPLCCLQSNDGHVSGLVSWSPGERRWWPIGRWRLDHTPVSHSHWAQSNRLGVTWVVEHGDTTDVGVCVADGWIVGLPAGVLTAVVAVLWRTRPPSPGRCRCGYDLRATPGRCPECGTAVSA